MPRRIKILNRIIRVYDFFRYDLPRFIKNLWAFRKDIYYFRPDMENSYLYFLHTSLMQGLKMHMENHVEEDVMHAKIIEKMQRAIELLTIHINDTYSEEAEKMLGVKHSETISLSDGFTEDDLKLLKKSMELEEKNWGELWRIIKGQSVFERVPDEWGTGFPDNFDGTGIKHWGD
jgi:hypothetical protein